MRNSKISFVASERLSLCGWLRVVEGCVCMCMYLYKCVYVHKYTAVEDDVKTWVGYVCSPVQ